MDLEKEVKEAEERLCKVAKSEATSREVAIIKARQRAVEEFKWSEEYMTSHNYNVGYDDRYDKGVKDIFFNIWRKRHEVNFKFLGKEYQVLMADWEEQEKKGELDTKPPPSLENSDEDCKIV